MGTPPWLDKSFLMKVLTNAVEIEDFRILPAITKGNNMLSEALRAVVTWNDGTRHTSSLFFKLPYPKLELLSLNEIAIYTSVLPKMYALLKQEICPRYYYCSPENILVLEDLMESGFQMSKISTLVDYSHCDAGLRAIAKYHGASIAVHRSHPELIEELGSRGMAGNPDFLRLMVDVSLRVLAEIVDTCPDIKHFSTKINNIRQDASTIILDLFRKQAPNAVLNHGDCTVNNTMFKYGTNDQICDVRLFDFQLPSYGSFCIDLQMFLMSSVQTDVLTNKLDELLNTYKCAFNSTLEACSCPGVLTLEQVQQEFRNADCFGLYIVSTLFSMRVVGASKVASTGSFDMGAFVERNDTPFRKLMSMDEYKLALPAILMYFDNRGLFNSKVKQAV